MYQYPLKLAGKRINKLPLGMVGARANKYVYFVLLNKEDKMVTHYWAG